MHMVMSHDIAVNTYMYLNDEMDIRMLEVESIYNCTCWLIQIAFCKLFFPNSSSYMTAWFKFQTKIQFEE